MSNTSSMLYECQDTRYEKDFTKFVSPSSASISSTLKSTTSFFNFSDLSGLDFVKFVHPGNIVKPQVNLDKLSHDEKFLLLKAEKEENEYYSELQMTTLMNSRYD